MLKPSDLPSPIINNEDRVDIEEYIDATLRRHAAAGAPVPWPLVIDTKRSGWLREDIEAVLSGYRSNGWDVMSGGNRALCVIRPCVHLVDRVDEELAEALKTSRG